MKIHIITIFPESFDSFLKTSIIWKAIEKKLFEIFLYKLNDFSSKSFKHVDDNAYWMHWQVLSPEPLLKAINHIQNWKKMKIIYMSPSWILLNQEKIEKFYIELSGEFIIICGHYEWIDQRIIDLFVDYEVSIWEYILTSWELASQVFIDSLARQIPNVLWNSKSVQEESFSQTFNRQKEHPVYTRPAIFQGLEVPKVLLSGNHKEIEKWKFNNLKK